jgi:hypothetical protein
MNTQCKKIKNFFMFGQIVRLIALFFEGLSTVKT